MALFRLKAFIFLLEYCVNLVRVGWGFYGGIGDMLEKRRGRGGI